MRLFARGKIAVCEGVKNVSNNHPEAKLLLLLIFKHCKITKKNQYLGVTFKELCIIVNINLFVLTRVGNNKEFLGTCCIHYLKVRVISCFVCIFRIWIDFSYCWTRKSFTLIEKTVIYRMKWYKVVYICYSCKYLPV